MLHFVAFESGGTSVEAFEAPANPHAIALE